MTDMRITGSSQTETRTQPPNLLFVFADQLRGSDLGCAGNPDVQTPTLDRFAAEGLRLTHCFATTPVCGPNRAVLLTGTYPTTNGVLGNDLPLPLGLPTLATLAKAQGYRTGYIGKWHLDGLPRSRFTPPGPRRFGFDYWAAYNCTHDYFHPRYFRDTPEVIEAEGYEPEVQTDLALGFLNEQDPAQPFCLVVSWGPPHDPYPAVPETYRAAYDPDLLTLRPNVVPDADNPLARGLECRRTTADYYAAISALDDQFARLLQKLDERGLSENTLVVFTSDHGDMLWSHGWMKKQAPYEESVSVPFLCRLPGAAKSGGSGRVSDVLLGTVDLLPTLGGLLGWELPDGIEGQDLSAAVRGEADALHPRALLLAHYLAGDEAARQGMPEWRAVRTHRHTYVETPFAGETMTATSAGGCPWLLFDNEADPFQQENLLESAQGPTLAAELQAMLAHALLRAGDPFLDGTGMLDRAGATAAWEARQRQMGAGT
jgi:arylsulfatase A-like enzyme